MKSTHSSNFCICNPSSAKHERCALPSLLLSAIQQIDWGNHPLI